MPGLDCSNSENCMGYNFPEPERSKPSSRNFLIGEQPNAWDLLQPRAKLSRHRCRIVLPLLGGSDYIFIQLRCNWRSACSLYGVYQKPDRCSGDFPRYCPYPHSTTFVVAADMEFTVIANLF